MTDTISIIVDPAVTPPVQPTDQELAQRWCQGDRRAAAILVERHQKVVRSFLRRLVSRADWADDLAQETFLRLLTHAERYDPRYPMRTWLLTIARRLYLNHAQLAGHRVIPIAIDPPGPPASGQQALAEAREQQARLRQRLQQALAHLPESQRAALVLFYQQEMSVRQIARVMEIPEGTVKSHLSRGRVAMRQWLENSGEGALP